MSQPSKRGRGFSSSPPVSPARQPPGKPAIGIASLEKKAVALIGEGRLEEAEVIYRGLIDAGRASHVVCGNLAAICGMQERWDEMVALLRRTLELNPAYADAHYNLGIALQSQGDLGAAIASYERAIELRPDYPEAHNNLGNALREKGDLEAAFAAYGRALRLRPDFAEAHYNLGNVLHDQGKTDAAVTAYQTALSLQPTYPEAHNNLGNAWKDLGDLEAAITSYAAAIRLKPDYPEARNNLGNAWKEQGNLEAAIASYRAALRLSPDFAEVHGNLGNALQEQGDLDAAMAAYDAALRFNPDYADAHWNSASAMLLRGDYENGWEQYEWRLHRDVAVARPHASPACPRWDGQPLGAGDRVLLVSEQGLGDTLQFMRYAIALRDQGAVVSLCAQPKLHGLIEASGIDPAPLTPEQASQVCDGKWIPLLSVPRVLGVTPDNPIITAPYIRSTPARISQ